MLSEPVSRRELSVSPRHKVRDIQELASSLNALRAAGNKVILCHGVFDPLHIGHIRHFQQARKFGHVLVVSVTPDRFVNKGPHRPVFPEELRAEAIAALECVDYVVVNKWPMAIEAIQVLRPDVFVKGGEFEQKVDRTGAIPLEEQAVSAIGGQIAFTHDVTFSASNLVNHHFNVLPRELSEYLRGLSRRFGTGEVVRVVEGIRPLRVLLVGETIIDEYHYCEALGKSSKEPTLAVKSLSVERFAGGVLAAANHVANFSDQVGLVSQVGDQQADDDFLEKGLHPSVQRTLVRRQQSPTIVKRRYVEQYFFSKLFEVYDINDGHLEEEDNARICEALREQLPRHDVVIVLDFGHGMLSGEAIDLLCKEARFLAVNTQSNAGNLGYHTISKYPRADYVCIAQNEIRLDARDRRGDLRDMVASVGQRLSAGTVMVTRGNKGSLGWSTQEGFVEVPALAGKVVDRVGAGDAFLAITAPCVAQDAPLEVVAFIGNVVGAQAVATVCNRAAVERVSLVRHIEHLLK
jgi:rfaE bifunctional protein nucleotidyltransferase chain/domain